MLLRAGEFFTFHSQPALGFRFAGGNWPVEAFVSYNGTVVKRTRSPNLNKCKGAVGSSCSLVGSVLSAQLWAAVWMPGRS